MMKKILLTITLILPLFVINNLQAQNNSNGAPHFDIYVHVSAPQQCPSTGTVKGETLEIGNEYSTYHGPDIYWLVWNSTLTYPQPVSAEVTTNKDANGYWCHDIKTETLTGADWGYNFYLHLNLIAPVGGDEQ